MVVLLISLVLVTFTATVAFRNCGWKRQSDLSFVCSSKHTSSKFFSAHFLASNIFEEIEDEEDLESFKKIASNYLQYKFLDCLGDDCKFVRTRDEVETLMKSVLPPVNSGELAREVENVMSKLGNGDIDADDYVAAVMENSYWQEAGAFVVKELIFLDCLHSYYYREKGILQDEDYNELKDQLTWEGSVAASLKGNEAHFITAVAASRRGSPIMSDEEYMALKSELNSQNSWVVNREPDPLERMGVSTFLAYLHRSL
mmetsp:Transcript_10654/g.17369  ORF Transcript_10654/g.17369 Transcript_10654/m.17369 type:complete len:257 (-) Transcript_10654:246-1016(-)